MTITVPTWVDPPHSDHATIGEAGDCPECRAWDIRSSKDGPHAFLLTFPPDDDGPAALTLIRDWAPNMAAETAWATGCNLHRCVRIEEIPVSVAVESGVEMFRLLDGFEAAEAWRAIQGARP